MIDIRTAHAEDFPQLVPLLGELGYPTAEVDLAARLDTILKRDDFATFIAVSGNRAVGLICLTLMPSLYRVGLQGAITTLVVSQAARGQGLGRQLIEHGESWLRGRGAVNVAVNPSSYRQGAHRHYEKAGFSGTGVRFTKSLSAISQEDGGLGSLERKREFLRTF